MTENNLSSVLAFEDRFPTTEQRLDIAFSEDQIHDLNQSAAEVLNAIITLEQMSYDHADPEAKGKSTELHRLEQKIDFVTEL